MFALTLAVGCVRLGYEAHQPPVDASHDDAGMAGGADGASGDAAPPREGGPSDAAGTDTSTPESGVPDEAGSPNDGATPEPDDGATPGDGATPEPDAGSTDAGADGGPEDMCPERDDAEFCNGFEQPNFGGWGYPVQDNGMTEQTMSPSPVRTDAFAMRAYTFSAGVKSKARRGVEAFNHLKSGEIWLRYYYYLPTSSVITTYFSSGVMSELQDPYFGFSLVIRPDGLDLASGNDFQRTTNVFPRDRWVCVELHAVIAAPGMFEAFLDDGTNITMDMPNTIPATGFSAIEVGIHYTDPDQGAMEVFVDDVVASTARVGCN